MSQLTRERLGNFPNDGKGKQPAKGKEMKNSAGDFKTGAILPKLPPHSPLDSGGVKESGFQNLRESTIRKGSI